MGVGDENNAYADGKEDDADGKDADVDGKEGDVDGKDADVDADAGGAPPSGTPRASCQLTLLTSPARVTRDGHYGDDDCVSRKVALN